ncbi:MAG TPA: tyrosine-type recombinase/integrase [Candidatus Binatia bacterium]|nr:tyrosine-type recombinase/integrase [Candidatus Binatia bacterium]
MGDVVPLRATKSTAREQLLAMVQHQAQVQGKNVAQYLRELQTQVERNGEGRRVLPTVTSLVHREKYTYLTKREVNLFFERITDLRDRALFGTMYYFGLRASEVGLLLREYVNFRTRRIYVSRLKSGVPGEKVMTSDCRRLLQSYLQSRHDALPYLFPSRNARPISRKRIDALFRHYATQAGLPPHKRHSHCLRHSIATHLIDAGQSLEYVQDHLGHRSIQSTGVYAKISDAKRERVAAQLELAQEVAKITTKRVRGGR